MPTFNFISPFYPSARDLLALIDLRSFRDVLCGLYIVCIFVGWQAPNRELSVDYGIPNSCRYTLKFLLFEIAPADNTHY